MKKIIALLMVLVLTLGCFAACKNTDKPADATPAPAAPAQEGTPEPMAGAEKVAVTIVVAGTFHKLGQLGKHRRRKSAPCRRLAGCQADLSLGPSEAGNGIHHQQNALALVAEILGYRSRCIRRFQPFHG